MTPDTAEFWTIVAAIGQVAGALATAWAVIITMRIVSTERRPIMTIRADLALIIGDGQTPTQDVITVTVANIGVRRFKCTGLSWRTGHLRRGPAWLKRQYAVQMPTYLPGSPQPPFTLEPGDQVSILIDPQPFQSDKRAALREQFFCRRYPWKAEPQQTRIDVGVDIAAHTAQYQKVGPGLAALLATGKITNGGARFDQRANAQLQQCELAESAPQPTIPLDGEAAPNHGAG
ncbi:hypothetical protein GG804_11685 [Sphingomonas histidinilytica]|jgi:hypothetical protein|uniref:hypothetical protein n=1 Tax=Rhizorhabdus histidinilytica TaxID=439228 RepID=UPI001ADC1873|nr:hypothetical protein [Rhizorhabdus histidinilytica]MBO9377430.1 hypothetical protein [Rhizorhabdus histidinilytica]